MSLVEKINDVLNLEVKVNQCGMIKTAKLKSKDIVMPLYNKGVNYIISMTEDEYLDNVVYYIKRGMMKCDTPVFYKCKAETFTFVNNSHTVEGPSGTSLTGDLVSVVEYNTFNDLDVFTNRIGHHSLTICGIAIKR